MAIKFNRSQTFATNGTVTAAGLHNLVDGLDIYQALITDQTNLTSVGTADELLIADADLTANDAPRAVTVQELFSDALTIGTYTDANFTGNLTYGTATGNRTVSTSATITTGTINNATLGTTTGTAATFTNATATGANITSGTIQTLTSSTATITAGTISNFSTTLSGDITISQGIATLGTTGVTAGTYGASAIIPSIVVDAKGRITTVSTASVSGAEVGSIIAWTTGTAPSGYLHCNGAAINRTTYAALFSVLSTTYGTGDGSTTFNIPDYRGRFLRGFADGQTADPDRTSRTNRGDGTTGDNVGTKQDDALQNLTGQVYGSYAAIVRSAATGVFSDSSGASGISLSTPSYSGSQPTDLLDFNASKSSGARTSTETRPTNISVMWCIKF